MKGYDKLEKLIIEIIKNKNFEKNKKNENHNTKKEINVKKVKAKKGIKKKCRHKLNRMKTKTEISNKTNSKL